MSCWPFLLAGSARGSGVGLGSLVNEGMNSGQGLEDTSPEERSGVCGPNGCHPLGHPLGPRGFSSWPGH